MQRFVFFVSPFYLEPRVALITSTKTEDLLMYVTAYCAPIHSIKPNEPGSKLLVLGMVIQPLIGNPYNGYINPLLLG